MVGSSKESLQWEFRKISPAVSRILEIILHKEENENVVGFFRIS
jgi:hypothetical protein